MKQPKILLVDDTPQNLDVLYRVLRDEYEIFSATSGRKALMIARTHHPDLILLDVMMPEMDGYEVCAALKDEPVTRDIPVIFVTVRTDHESEQMALATGGVDFITKPVNADVVRARVRLHLELVSHRRHLEELVHIRTGELEHALAENKALRERLEAENSYLREEIDENEYGRGEIIGTSVSLRSVITRLHRVALTGATVLLSGETGTGKGLFARFIHQVSDRRDKPFVTVNCAGLPVNLIESELFGREKGAFTGAAARQIGRFGLADGGTIFLDEIGELPIDLQTKLLRVVEEGEFERLGSPHTEKVDVRIIAATNRDLEEEIRSGRFRKDLYYRLSVFPVTIPPLRQRAGDIPLLVGHFVAKLGAKYRKRCDGIPAATMEQFERYGWPGNVRELINVIERGVIVSNDAEFRLTEHLGPMSPFPGAADMASASPAPEAHSLVGVEREHILRVLRETGWRIEGETGAARILDMHPNTLRARLKKLGIRRPGT